MIYNNCMKNIAFIFGTRPEVIKLAPVILELKKYPELYKVLIINTEQQKELSNQTLGYFGLKSDYNLDSMRDNQSLTGVQTRIMNALDEVYKKESIDAVVVQGDTMTVLCGALTAFYNKIPLLHVEAGLRSYDKFEPFPEEGIRQMVSRLADINFAPTEANRRALIKENINPETVHVVGNTVIDALSCLTESVMKSSEAFFSSHEISVEKLVLITVHRRENHGERLDNIIRAITLLAENYPDFTFVIPVHPNPNVKFKIEKALGCLKNIKLLPPLDYPNLVYLMKHAHLILSDSGGIQEEAPAFGCPVIVLRYETERKEGIEAGVSVLAGADYDKIISESKKILSKTKQQTRLSVKNPYGDGLSSSRIEKLIRNL